MHSCPAAKLLMIVALGIATGNARSQSEGGPEHDPLPTLTGDRVYALDATLEGVVQSFSIPGLAVGIVENGEPAYVRAFGVRDVDTGEPVTVHTLFHIASITKTFTATAVMQLVEQNRLALAAPIARYVPAFADSPVTVTQLLTHSAGLEDISHRSANDDAAAVAGYVSTLAKREPSYEPGQGWGYTDAAFNVLGAVIESAAGVDYASYMQTQVLAKAAMSESTFSIPPANGNVAWPHTGKVFVQRASSYPWDRAHLPSAGLNASITDMTRWAALHLKHDPALLSPTSYAAMFKHHRDTTWDGMAMGLGWQLERRGDGWLPRHAGQEHGFSALITLYPEQQRAIVILSNGETTPRGEIRHLIESVLAGGSFATPRPPLLLRSGFQLAMGAIALIVALLVTMAVRARRRRR
jgi:CubicO group peptidase (beta-lactamase class C family)